MEALIIKVIVAVVVAIGGAITEHETNGAVTTSIGYADENQTRYECKEIK